MNLRSIASLAKSFGLKILIAAAVIVLLFLWVFVVQILFLSPPLAKLNYLIQCLLFEIFVGIVSKLEVS